ncbi:MAG: UbiA family prenyltransferase [Flavobacteriales bacterium]|nr:UbiA family prenyltransferase [Flavobacteriales bacterium]
MMLIGMMLLTAWIYHVSISLWLLIMILSVICVAAGGNVWNDVCDKRCDEINKPDRTLILTVYQAKRLYFILIGIGSLVAIIMMLKGWYFVPVFVFSAIIGLHLYSLYLKSQPIIGNVLIAILSVLPLIMVIKYVQQANNELDYIKTKLMVFYIFFAFLLSWIRETIKDIEDMPGDQAAGYKTLPIVTSSQISKVLSFVLAATLLGISIHWVFWLEENEFLLWQLLIMILILFIPFFPFSYVLYQSQTKDDYGKLSRLIKIWMLIGILTLTIWI